MILEVISFSRFTMTLNAVIELSKWRWGRDFCRWGVKRRGGVSIVFRNEVEKEVGVEFCHQLY